MNAIDRLINGLFKHRIMIANLALIGVLLVGVSYLSFGVLRYNPFTSSYKLVVELPNSGGLQTTSDVTMRGVRIGKVDEIKVAPRSVRATLKIQDKYKINKDAEIKVLALSGAGEQYIDFAPSSNKGPHWGKGAVVTNPSKTHVTVQFSEMLRNSIDVVSSLDMAKLRTTIVELDKALNGTGTANAGQNNIKTLLLSSGVLFANLYSVLPQTQTLVKNAGTILETSSNIQPDLGRTTAGLGKLISSLNAADSELRTLLQRGPSQLTTLTGSLNQLRDPLTDVLKQVLDVARQGALRAPALANLLPSARDGLAQSGKMFHDGAWWAMASIYPRPYCVYPVTPSPPTKILEMSLPANLYCVTKDPTQQIRGADKAPRPAGDDTAGPPPNYDPKARWTPIN